jgi:hypothetical protein
MPVRLLVHFSSRAVKRDATAANAALLEDVSQPSPALLEAVSIRQDAAAVGKYMSFEPFKFEHRDDPAYEHGTGAKVQMTRDGNTLGNFGYVWQPLESPHSLACLTLVTTYLFPCFVCWRAPDHRKSKPLSCTLARN